MAKKEDNETPLMKQYQQIKHKYPGAILLFRVGDFYETFGEDAITASKILGIVLTKRANGSASHIELAGFPHHSLDTYLPKLVRAGQRVAICDQLEDPKMTKKIVKRGVTELITPGVSYNDKILDHKTNNYLASVNITEGKCGVAFVDISTGEFLVAEGEFAYIEKLIHSFKPAEIIVSRQQAKELFSKIPEHKYYSYQIDDWVFKYTYAFEKLTRHFHTTSLKGFGIQEMESAIISAGAALHYLHETHHEQISHIQSISRIDEEKYVWLDQFTIRNLELINPANEQGKSLLHIIDRTVTPMGARLMKRWLLLPLKDVTTIHDRLNVVSFVLKENNLRLELLDTLKQIGDMERLVSKIAMRRVSPRELQHLNKSLKLIAPLKEKLAIAPIPSITKLVGQLLDCTWVIEQLDNKLVDEPPAAINKGEVIKKGVDAELDDLKEVSSKGKDFLLQIQHDEQIRTGIPSLKVSFNNVFGYYLEVTNTHKDKVPAEWIRKQTLTNAERYITDELKQYEDKILGAEEKIQRIEERIYNELVISLGDYVNQILQNAIAIAQLDCLISFAELASVQHYVRPVITDKDTKLLIKDARHPVIEQQLPLGESYIANDIYLDQESQQMIILTGPNMSGKSAILRQTALIAIMAQIGCFVPASMAEIGLVDKIFTRVGASDNISGGESTFMVEMTETASILNNLSNRSLILLDEIGRGTSTYDGVSIAWAIAEYLHNHPAKPKTLFATHYHELNELEQLNDRIKNFHILTQETENKILFLRKLEKGSSEHSFGIHVARMAGVPQLVAKRADEILHELEQQRQKIGGETIGAITQRQPMQLSMFQLSDPAFDKIKNDMQMLDINTLTPVEALMKLNEWKRLLNF
jgi:DNA mismatch repair protein MutS